MENINAFEDKGDSEEINYGDFGAEGTATYADVQPGKTPEELAFNHKKKADVTSAIVTVGVNAIPLVTDIFKHRKDPTPYKVDKNDVICLGLASIIPVFQAVDTLAFKGKCQETINTKVFRGMISCNDVRNIVNLVNMYAPVHNLLSKTMDQMSAKSAGTQVVPIDSFTKTRAAIGITTLIAPYVADKLTDDSKSMSQRVSSILPLPVIGTLVRTAVSKSNDTKIQSAYQVTNAVINAASAVNRNLTPAVRATSFGNTANKVSSEFDSALGLASQLMGVSRGNIGGGMYGGGYNNGMGYNNGWANMSY